MFESWSEFANLVTSICLSLALIWIVLLDRRVTKSRILDQYHKTTMDAMILMRLQEIIKLMLEKDRKAQKAAAEEIMIELNQLFTLAWNNKLIIEPINKKYTKNIKRPVVKPKEIKLSSILKRNEASEKVPSTDMGAAFVESDKKDQSNERNK